MDVAQLQTRLEREKRARKQAEALLEEKSRELFSANEELRVSAQELGRQTKHLNTVFDVTLAGVFLIDKDQVIRLANRSAKIMFGYEDKEMVGRSIIDLFHKEHRSDIQMAADGVKPGITFGNADQLYDFDAQRADGTTFPLELALAAFEHDGDSHTVCICRDLTRRRAAEAERVRLERELSQSQKLESLGTLASGIAHEINTPIQYVSDNAHFLKDAFDDLNAVLKQHETLIQASAEGGQFEDQVAKIRAAEEEADLSFLLEEIPGSISQTIDGIGRISTIVTAIKEFAHPGTEEKTAIDLNTAIETTITVARNQWKYAAELETDFDPTMPMVPCLPGDLNQVILNLIVNAAHAIEARGEDKLGKISIQTKFQNGKAEIRVTDTGCGIAEENKERIYDPFFTTKEVGKGTGQGLNISYNIITAKHGGAITFTSKVGEGTTFLIELPIESAPQLEEVG